MEFQEKRVKPGQRENPHYRHQNPHQRHASYNPLGQHPKKIPPLDGHSPGCSRQQVDARPSGGGVDPPYQPLYIPHVLDLPLVENLPFFAKDTSFHQQRLIRGVEVVSDLAGNLAQVLLGDAGREGDAVLLESPVIDAGVVERPGYAGGDQEQGNGEDENKGCPWVREQTHESLKRTLLEESYEVLEAIDQKDPNGLSEELGDLLLQVAFHAVIAREAGEFSITDVITHINQKLIRRHPHVFGDGTASDADEVEANWEQLKAAERAQDGGRKSPVEGIPGELPALTYAQLMQDRVGRAGFEWEDISGVLDKVAEEVEELRGAATEEERVHELGDLMFTMVNLSRWMNIHAEDALRQANRRFQGRYLQMEELADQRGQDFAGMPLMEKESLWQEAKGLEGG